MRTTVCFVLSALLLGAAVPAWAQPQAQPPESPDLTAYRVIFDDMTTPPKKIELAEVFLADTRTEFLESMWRENVFVILFLNYQKEKNWTKVLDTVDRLEKLVPKMAPAKRVDFYSEGMGVAGSEQKVDKALEYAKKILTLDPKNVRALLTLTTIPALPADPEAQRPILLVVIEYGQQVLKLDKPEGVPDDQWQNVRTAITVQNQKLTASMLLAKKDYVACADAYQELVRMTPKDAAAQYYLGYCYYFQVKAANEAVIAAQEKLRAFVIDCNKASEAAYEKLKAFIDECNETRSCGTEENTAKRMELEAQNEAATCESEPNKVKKTEFADAVTPLLKDFDAKRDKALDAFARSVAIGGPGQEPALARTQLENLYKTKGPDATPLEQFIQEKKKELGE